MPDCERTPQVDRTPNVGSLEVLQRTPRNERVNDVARAADEVSSYHAVTGEQQVRLKNLERALADFLVAIHENVPACPDRSNAISRAREAKMWASAAVAMEGL